MDAAQRLALGVLPLLDAPEGRRGRLTVDGEWHRGEALSDGLALVDLALEWRKQFEAKGWGRSE